MTQRIETKIPGELFLVGQRAMWQLAISPYTYSEVIRIEARRPKKEVTILMDVHTLFILIILQILTLFCLAGVVVVLVNLKESESTEMLQQGGKLKTD